MEKDGIYMIWPEFLRSDGTVMQEDETLVLREGQAFMWILLFDQMKEYHRARATVGRLCWFMEGTRKVAEARIVEQIGLKSVQ
jgi:hypothetical protein